MRILVLNGSPRLGNTNALLEAFMVGAKAHDIDYIDLADQKVLPCIACNACEGLNGDCKDQDDTNMILNLVRSADAVIFASPVYWWGISAQLKALIDKFYAFHSEGYKKYKKKVGLLTVGGSKKGAKQYQIISDQFKCICDFLEWDFIIDESFSAYNIGDIDKNPEALEICRLLGNNL